MQEYSACPSSLIPSPPSIPPFLISTPSYILSIPPPLLPPLFLPSSSLTPTIVLSSSLLPPTSSPSHLPYSLPPFQLPYSYLSPPSCPLLPLSSMPGSGVGLHVRRIFAGNPRWYNAWITLSAESYGWYRIADIFWRRRR